MQKGDYAIHLNNQDCWPECLIKWPECAWKGPRNRLTISLALDENDERCMYTQLQESDKNLSRALWTVAEELYELTANSPKLNRSNVARNYKQWKSHIEKMVGQIKKSHYFNDATVLEIVPRPILQTTLKDTVTSPLPAGITAEQRVESTNALMRIEADLDLATLLLPTAPVNQNRGPSSTDIKLKDLLTDLAFQLK